MFSYRKCHRIHSETIDLRTKNHTITQIIGNYFKSIWVSIEIFNLANIQNTSSYIWISDASNNYYGVNNYLTGRILNFKLNIKL